MPVGNGILTVDKEAQAWARARPDGEDKGAAAASAALALVRLKRSLAKGPTNLPARGTRGRR
jgi:6,7-dimethyl-8-ribityllumazine synthase